MRSLLAALGLALLPACFLSQSSTDRSLDPALVGSLRPGEMSAGDVAGLLGSPTRVVELGDRSAWLYEHLREKEEGAFMLLLILRGVDVQADRVWVFFDEAGRLTHVASSFEAESARYDLPLF